MNKHDTERTEIDNRERLELRRIVLGVMGDGSVVRWENIREKFFEKMGTHWIPTRTWTGREDSAGVDEKVWGILLGAQLLSPEKDGNYLIIGANVILGPHIHIVNLYFTNLKDAKEYVELLYGGAQYEIEIIKCKVEAEMGR